MASKKKKYVIVRTYSSGVFAGFLESRKGHEVILSNARRLWYWNGAAAPATATATATATANL